MAGGKAPCVVTSTCPECGRERNGHTHVIFATVIEKELTRMSFLKVSVLEWSVLYDYFLAVHLWEKSPNLSGNCFICNVVTILTSPQTEL